MAKEVVEFRAAAIPKKSSSIFDMGTMLSAVKSAVRNERRRAVRRGEQEKKRKEWARREIAMVRQKRERERVLWSHRRGYPIRHPSFRSRAMGRLSQRRSRRLGVGMRSLVGWYLAGYPLPGGPILQDAILSFLCPRHVMSRRPNLLSVAGGMIREQRYTDDDLTIPFP